MLQLATGPLESAELGEQLERLERRAPTRPHPHAPADPVLLRVLSPAAAVLDRARAAVFRD